MSNLFPSSPRSCHSLLVSALFLIFMPNLHASDPLDPLSDGFYSMTNAPETEETNEIPDSSIRMRPPEKTEKRPLQHRFTLSAETGLGNIITLHAGYALKMVHVGLGCGYSYYWDDTYETDVNILEPFMMLSCQFGHLLLRVRIGMDFLTESKYGLSDSSFLVSPDILFIQKGFYAGFGLPMISGSEGFGLAPSIGAGYTFQF